MDNFKQRIKYWFLVIVVPAFKSSVPFAELRDKSVEMLISVLAALALVLVLGNTGQLNDVGANFPTVLLTLGFTFLMRFFSGLFYLPGKTYQDQEEKITKLSSDISALNERHSSKRIKIDSLGIKLVKNSDVELRPVIKNDSSYTLKDYYALIEEVLYIKSGNEKPEETSLLKNFFHLVWPGIPPIAYRTEPIPPHDNAQLAIAETIPNTNAFKFSTKESDPFNKFEKEGLYLVTLKIGGTFDGVGINAKRIKVVIYFNGAKYLEINTHWDLPDEVQ